MKFVAFLLPLLLCVSGTQTDTPKRYITTEKVEVFAAPNEDAKVISKIPANTILEPVGSDGPAHAGYFKVRYKNKEGWVFKIFVRRYMEPPAPDLDFRCAGYKIIGGTYRSYFAVFNDGMRDYSGPITMRLYKGDKRLLEKTVDFSSPPIEAGEGGPFYLDSTEPADRWEFITRAGKFEGQIGRLIETIP
ncbi:MAG TPA: SH3 domain-containing protein [Pyrinomonadaceae bacterium]|jgi:hypothetical protein|nr:SH3 domain-containing protein [Pyrinomonadaceae bacterium]